MVGKYIKDNDKIQEILDQWQAKGEVKYCKVDSVKVRNKVTRCQNLIRDIFFVALGNNSDKPAIVCGIYSDKDNIFYLSRRDLIHWNVNPDFAIWNFALPSGNYKLYYRKFCNPVLQSHLWANPERASKILKGNLMEGNPNDRWRTPNSVDVDCRALPLFYRDNGQLIKNSASLENFYYMMVTPPTEVAEIRKFNEICERLKNDHNLRYCYYALNDSIKPEFKRGLINKQDILDGKYIVSEYYKSYSYRDVGEITEIPKEEYNVACIGCGSAGSNILDQLIRLNYFPKGYLLVDFDTVEEKNLRNQMFDRSSIGGYKAISLKDILKCIKNVPVKTYNTRYEEVPFSYYKFDYIISGFDSIECRLGLLQKIFDKEIEAKYLIDARYNDLDASLFMVDLANQSEVEYYHKLLLQDLEEFNRTKIEYYPATEWNEASIRKYNNDTYLLTSRCSDVAREISGNATGGCCRQLLGRYCNDGCGCEECFRTIKEFFVKYNFKLPAKYKVTENSCLSENIVHIYKLVSSWVTANIRSIETDEKKLFTHVDITTEPLPNAIILRK